eukprot:g3182.t1
MMNPFGMDLRKKAEENKRDLNRYLPVFVAGVAFLVIVPIMSSEFKNIVFHQRKKKKKKHNDKKRKKTRRTDQKDLLLTNVQTSSGTNVGISSGTRISSSPQQSKSIIHNQNQNLKLNQFRRSLPIFQSRASILKALTSYDVLVLTGETGSGKSTQIPQFILDYAFNPKSSNEKRMIIGCTQPRRVAAITIAKRVSRERNLPQVGHEVGYRVRFDNCTNKAGFNDERNRTKIKFLTDGMLLREAMVDPWLLGYRYIVLDEAHERSLQTDVLLALVKQVALRRKAAENIPNLNIIVMSATINMESFVDYFKAKPDNAIPQLTIPTQQLRNTGQELSCTSLAVKGRTFPVRTWYLPTPEDDVLDAALVTILQIHLQEAMSKLKTTTNEEESQKNDNHKGSDILVFLTGQEEIEGLCSLIQAKRKLLPPSIPDLFPCPLYAALSPDKQLLAFRPAPNGARKVVVATNIAETSVTIDGIKYVIDSGLVKSRRFNPSAGVEILRVGPISRQQAAQRMGRAGRVGPGQCYRLYTEETMSSIMPEKTIPEIQRCSLTNVLLQLKAIETSGKGGGRRRQEETTENHNISTATFSSKTNPPAVFTSEELLANFIEPPPRKAIKAAASELIALQAMNIERHQGTGQPFSYLTSLGKQMSVFPLEPRLSKLLLTSVKLQCVKEALDLIACLAADENLFLRARNQSSSINANTTTPMATVSGSKVFRIPRSDHLTMINALRSFLNAQSEGSFGRRRGASKKNKKKNKQKKRKFGEGSDQGEEEDDDEDEIASKSMDDIGGGASRWCREHGLSYRAVRKSLAIRKQLKRQLDGKKIEITSQWPEAEPILKAIAQGCNLQIARRENSSEVTSYDVSNSSSSAFGQGRSGSRVDTGSVAVYRTVGSGVSAAGAATGSKHQKQSTVHVHPSSCLFGLVNYERQYASGNWDGRGKKKRRRAPDFVVYNEIVKTSKPYMRCISAVKIEWLPPNIVANSTSIKKTQ